MQSTSRRTLIGSEVALAIGSDSIGDSSVLEAEHLHLLGVVNSHGYEASFLALEGNPLED